MDRKIFVIKYGETTLRESYIFSGGRRDVMLPISFVIYLIQDGERNILVDAGCNDGAGFEMVRFQKPSVILKECGVSPADVTDIIITHHHHDHIEAVKDYPNAVVYMQKDEYELGKTYLLQGMRVELFDDFKEVAEGLKVLKIGGHSEGSCVVICCCQDKEYLFCGDECYVKACIENQIPTGTSWNPNVSEKFIQTYGTESYEFLLFHDPDILNGRLGVEEIPIIQ